MAVYNLENYLEKDGLGFPLNFRRGNPNPLDNSSVHKSLTDAETYAKNDPTAYVGQILSVVDYTPAVTDDEGKVITASTATVTVYKIENEAGDLERVGTVPVGDDATITVGEDGKIRLYGLDNLPEPTGEAVEDDTTVTYQPLLVDGKLTWIIPSSTTVEGLSAEIEALKTSVGNKVHESADKSLITSTADGVKKIAVQISKQEGNALTLTDDGLLVDVQNAEYTVVKAENAETGYSATYHLQKDGVNVGAAINIPKDMVVQSGSVVTLEANQVEGQAAGTYIRLVLANTANDTLYIPVDGLIEYVTSGSASTDMVVISVSDDHKVTATITDKSITTAKIADKAITGDKIADGTIAVDKLGAALQEEIGKAHEHENADVIDAINEADVAKWNAAATASHDHGNKSVIDNITADKVSAWDSARANAEATAAAALNEAKATLENKIANDDATTLGAAKDYADGLGFKYDPAGAAASSLNDAKSYADGLATNYDAAGSADDALETAKAYADDTAGTTLASANQYTDTAVEAAVEAAAMAWGEF